MLVDIDSVFLRQVVPSLLEITLNFVNLLIYMKMMKFAPSLDVDFHI